MASNTKTVFIAYTINTTREGKVAVIFSVSSSQFSVRFAAMLAHPWSARFLRVTGFPKHGTPADAKGFLHRQLDIPVRLSRSLAIYEY